MKRAARHARPCASCPPTRHPGTRLTWPITTANLMSGDAATASSSGCGSTFLPLDSTTVSLARPHSTTWGGGAWDKEEVGAKGWGLPAGQQCQPTVRLQLVDVHPAPELHCWTGAGYLQPCCPHSAAAPHMPMPCCCPPRCAPLQVPGRSVVRRAGQARSTPGHLRKGAEAARQAGQGRALGQAKPTRAARPGCSSRRLPCSVLSHAARWHSHAANALLASPLCLWLTLNNSRRQSWTSAACPPPPTRVEPAVPRPKGPGAGRLVAPVAPHHARAARQQQAARPRAQRRQGVGVHHPQLRAGGGQAHAAADILGKGYAREGGVGGDDRAETRGTGRGHMYRERSAA